MNSAVPNRALRSHLRPGDIERALKGSHEIDAEFLAEPALQQLVEWGNLEVHSDTSEVATVEDFWRVRNLYQMSVAGEAAQEAIALFEQSIRQPGELQAAALDDIRRHLNRIAEISTGGEAKDSEVADVFNSIRQRFDELTAQAQRFMGGIQRRIDLQSLDVESFLTYKQRLIDYLERFLRELVMATHEISTMYSLDRSASRAEFASSRRGPRDDRSLIRCRGRAGRQSRGVGGSLAGSMRMVRRDSRAALAGGRIAFGGAGGDSVADRDHIRNKRSSRRPQRSIIGLHGACDLVCPNRKRSRRSSSLARRICDAFVPASFVGSGNAGASRRRAGGVDHELARGAAHAHFAAPAQIRPIYTARPACGGYRSHARQSTALPG